MIIARPVAIHTLSNQFSIPCACVVNSLKLSRRVLCDLSYLHQILANQGTSHNLTLHYLPKIVAYD